MTERDPIEAVRDGLVQIERGLVIAPIRHHSPACAWALRELIREVRPVRVLIEGPVDFGPHIDLLLDPATRPPVAIAALVEAERDGGGPEDGEPARLAAYYPLCDHSPELVALREGRAVGAELAFIDLPSTAKALRRRGQGDDPDDPDDSGDSEGRIALQDETRFDSSDYVAALAARLGCRDGFELWDHLFETRLGERDWRAFFADVGSYCAGIRAATPLRRIEAHGDAAREAHMAARTLAALAAGGPVVVVVGGFHAPALIEAVAAGRAPEPRLPKGTGSSYLIRYGFEALDALNGYAAGLPQPGWYDRLWRRAEAAGGAPRWRETALELVSEFARAMRVQGHAVPVPAQVEALRAAEALARLRGRPGALRFDLIDGLRTALVKGEASVHEVWTERFLAFLRGTAIGDVPPSAGSPPLVEDARQRARAHRIDVSDGARRRRRLDIRRSPAHLAASRYLHAMTLLDTGFARREVGPDLLNGIRTELLFEAWSYAWSPAVEGRLVELAALGDRLPAVALALLRKRRRELKGAGRSDDLDALTTLLGQGLLAGLGARLAPFVTALGSDVAACGDIAAVARALRRLHHIANAPAPLGAPETLDLDGIRALAYRRVVYLCDDLPATPPEALGARLDALRLVAELLRGPDGHVFDPEPFTAAMNRVADSDAPPAILGAVLAICVRAGARPEGDLLRALAGRFAGSVVDEADRIGVLRGTLHTAPELLWQVDALLDAVDAFLGGLAEDAFLALLPHLRLAFTALGPRETDRLAELLARLHGRAAAGFHAPRAQVTEADLQRGLALERRLLATLDRDGLAAWPGDAAGAAGAGDGSGGPAESAAGGPGGAP